MEESPQDEAKKLLVDLIKVTMDDIIYRACHKDEYDKYNGLLGTGSPSESYETFMEKSKIE